MVDLAWFSFQQAIQSKSQKPPFSKSTIFLEMNDWQFMVPVHQENISLTSGWHGAHDFHRQDHMFYTQVQSQQQKHASFHTGKPLRTQHTCGYFVQGLQSWKTSCRWRTGPHMSHDEIWEFITCGTCGISDFDWKTLGKWCLKLFH